MPWRANNAAEPIPDNGSSCGEPMAPAAFLVDFEVADTLVVAAVEVVAGRDAGLLRGQCEGVEQSPRKSLALDDDVVPGRCVPHHGTQRASGEPSTGNSLISPSASSSTAIAARIKPISRVMMLMPVRPSALAMRPEAENVA